MTVRCSKVAAYYEWLSSDPAIRSEGKLLDPEFRDGRLRVRESQFGDDIVSRCRNFNIAVALIHSFAQTRWHGVVPLAASMTLFMFVGFTDLCNYTIATPSKGVEYLLKNVQKLNSEMRTFLIRLMDVYTRGLLV